MKNPKRTCEYCEFWEGFGAVDSDEELGTCRRNVPTINKKVDQVGFETAFGIWPVTGAEDWCGEWRDADA